MTTVRELRRLLSQLDGDAIVTVWDDVLVSECDVSVERGPFTISIVSTRRVITEEDVS